MSPKFVDRKQKIKDIAQTALCLFSQRGYAATSVEQIAEAATIGKGTVYEYFKTKEDLLVAAVQEWVDQGEIQISAIMEGIDDPVVRLHSFVRRNMKLFNPGNSNNLHANRFYIELLQQTFMEGGAFYNKHDLLKEFRSKIRIILVDILLDGISKGIFKPEIARDAEKHAINLMAYLNGIGQYALTTKESLEYKTLVEFHMKKFLTLILTDTEE